VILENLELEDREAAQVELDELAEALRGSGLTVEVAPLDGSFHAMLEESADQVALDVLNVVLEEAESHALEAIIGTVITALYKWSKRRKHFRDKDDGEATALIWGPDGRVIREVRLPKPQEEIEDD
jgi:hypothetical protein